MSALETSIESLTTEHAALAQKLEQIDQQYRVERPVIVSQISQLAKALSALTGKPIAGSNGQTGRKPMSAEGKAAIKAGLERARSAKLAEATQAPAQKGVEASPAPPKPAAIPAKRDASGEKSLVTR